MAKRFLVDARGVYDLAHVSAVTRTPGDEKSATLHIKGGYHHTFTPFEEAVSMWISYVGSVDPAVPPPVVPVALATDQPSDSPLAPQV